MTTEDTPIIVVIAYNRPKSLARLLKSIERAAYPEVKIPLVISIDYSPSNSDVVEIANNFNWKFGEKSVIAHKKNLGLRKHVVSCGDLALEYGNVIILEDDLYVSKNFYYFSLAALNFSRDKDYIGGISLYNHKINVHKGEYFSAYEDGYDNWYFQFASSWGQSWSKEQWLGFKDWYNKNPVVGPNPNIPENVTNWSDKSWLKYFIAYLIETDKFFLYPKISLSTNFNDPGTHVGSDSTAYQLELMGAKKEIYNFSGISESQAVYDSFFENMTLNKYLPNIANESVSIDLYGAKKGCQSKYLLSSSFLDFETLQTYGRSLKPIDANIFENVNGSDFFLYDLTKKTKNHKKSVALTKYRRIVYSVKIVSFESATILFKQLFKEKIRNLLRKLRP